MMTLHQKRLVVLLVYFSLDRKNSESELLGGILSSLNCLADLLNTTISNRSLWKPVGGIDCGDIGHGFFTITCHNNEDRKRVLRDGPWFINRKFLTVRMWKPKFDPFRASFSAAAIWLILPALPSKHCWKNGTNSMYKMCE